ncbi:hypothetical protein RP20_CCG004732 [Aedes albopictus]|nr:hypothetical protein RP20_CCG004732 [Aedes albopictus]
MRAEALFQSVTQPELNVTILQYLISAISYLATHQVATFNSVFVELCPLVSSDNFLGHLVRSARLENIPRLVVTDSFTYGYDVYPSSPSLLVIHTGIRDVDNKLPVEFIQSLKVWDPSSRVLVLVEYNYRTRRFVKLFLDLLYQFKYRKVSLVDIFYFGIVRFDASGSLYGSNDFVVPSELFTDAMRNMNGKEIRYNLRYSSLNCIMTIFGPIGPDAEWLISTANFLNATLKRLRNPCSGRVLVGDECYVKFLFENEVSITLDRMTYSKLVPGIYRTLFGMEPNSDVVLVPNGRPLNIIELFLQPFSAGTWIFLFVTLAVMEIVKLLLPNHFINDPILLSICGIERYNLHAAGRYEKVCYISLIIIFYLMTSGYEAKLVALMTERPSTQVIGTLEELVNSKIPVIADLQTEVQNDSLIEDQLVNGTYDFDGVSAYLSRANIAPLLLALRFNYDLVLRRKRYVVMPEILRMRIGYYFTETRSPLIPWFHWTQRVFFESGLMEKMQGITISAIHTSARQFLHREGYKAFENYDLITFADFAPAWISLGVGLFGSGCVFLVEFLRNVRRHGRLGF